MRTEPPEIPVPVGRQNEASPWPTNHLNALVLPEVDAVAPVAEYLFPPDDVDLRPPDVDDPAVRESSLYGRHPDPAGTRSEPGMASQ